MGRTFRDRNANRTVIFRLQTLKALRQRVIRRDVDKVKGLNLLLRARQVSSS